MVLPGTSTLIDRQAGAFIRTVLFILLSSPLAFSYGLQQSYYLEVTQEDIFVEQKMWLSWFWVDWKYWKTKWEFTKKTLRWKGLQFFFIFGPNEYEKLGFSTNVQRGAMRSKTVFYRNLSMTQLLTHSVAHSTKPSSRPKTNNQPLKKFLGLVFSWVKVVKNWTSF